MSDRIHEEGRKIANQIKTEIEANDLAEIINKVSRKCFSLCVQYPKESFTTGETNCINKCTDRWFDAQNLVGREVLREMQIENKNNSAVRFEKFKKWIGISQK